jgi:hypothetical protein
MSPTNAIEMLGAGTGSCAEATSNASKDSAAIKPESHTRITA